MPARWSRGVDEPDGARDDGVHRGLRPLERGARVDERAEEHVAGDPRRHVQPRGDAGDDRPRAHPLTVGDGSRASRSPRSRQSRRRQSPRHAGDARRRPATERGLDGPGERDDEGDEGKEVARPALEDQRERGDAEHRQGEQQDLAPVGGPEQADPGNSSTASHSA